MTRFRQSLRRDGEREESPCEIECAFLEIRECTVIQAIQRKGKCPAEVLRLLAGSGSPTAYLIPEKARFFQRIFFTEEEKRRLGFAGFPGEIFTGFLFQTSQEFQEILRAGKGDIPWGFIAARERSQVKRLRRALGLQRSAS